MGYYSEGVLGVTKSVITRCKLMDNNLPSFVTEGHMTEHGCGHYVFYSYDSRKMYESYPEVQEFYSWFDWMDDNCEGDSYGYLEVGEDGESSERGNPDAFDIYKQVSIVSPVS